MKKPVFNMPPESLVTRAIREGRTPFLYAALFSLVTNALYLALPVFTNQVFGRVLSSQSVETLLVLTVGTVGVFAVSGVIDMYRARILTNFGVIFDQRISSHVFSAVFDGVSRREVASAQPLRDLDTFRQTMTGAGIGVLFDLPWVPLYTLVLFIIDPLVGLVTLIGGVILLILALIQDKASRPAIKAANDAALKSYAFTETGLRNSEVVRAMGMLPNIGRKWGSHRYITMTQGATANRNSDYWGNWIKFVRMAVQILIIALGAYLIIAGEIGAGMLFANMILSSRALAPIERGVASWSGLVGASQAYERLSALMADYTPAQPGTELPRPKGQLSVEGLNFAAPNSARLLLTGVNFQIPAGDFLGVIGPSGAGKSTLARLLVGVSKPLNGAVRLDGADVFNWPREDFGKHVGYLPQDTELFAGTVRDNIARFQPDVADGEVIAAAQAAGVHDMIVRLPSGYDTDVGAGGVVLSVGQRQRVGLARALLRDPAFIVLDEPNANLDAQGETALASALKGVKARGGTVVVVSHKPSILRDADRLLVLRDGRIELFGPREGVMTRLAENQAKAAALAAPPLETAS